jgi:hypothetical protein
MTTITLGGKERELRFSFLSLKALEDMYDKPIAKVFEDDIARGGLSELTVMLWACLRKEKLTIGKVEELIDAAIENDELTLVELSESLKRALADSKITKAVAGAGGTDDPNEPTAN